MWKTYSAGYLKHNRAICASVMAAAFIAALFLSFLCGLFYNFWQDDIAGVIEEEGAWHGRILGELDEEDISFIREKQGSSCAKKLKKNFNFFFHSVI